MTPQALSSRPEERLRNTVSMLCWALASVLLFLSLIHIYLAEGILCRGLDTFCGDWAYALSRMEACHCIYLDTFVHGGFDQPLKTLVNVTARQLSVWGGSTQLDVYKRQDQLRS